MTIPGRPLVSVVVPFLNEEENIGRLHEALTAALAHLENRYEIIFVDDGSTDDTLSVARQLAAGDSRLRIISFRRNYGQTPAMAAGIDHARGEIILTMDGDLQNDPRDISAFLDKMREGYDIVVGWRQNRQDKLITRKIPSRIANWLIGRVTGVPIRDNGCSLKAYRASVIREVPLYSEMHRFIPAMASVAGARIAEIGVRHHARQYGRSKYGLSRIYKVLLDLLTIKTLAGFFSRPTFWFSVLAAPFFVLGAALLGYSLLVSADRGMPLPLAGTGLLLLTVSGYFVFCGALGELIYATGEVRSEEFARLTAAVSEAIDRSAR
jgi:glycosyltransferase involved in cell wall biosynthesis